MRLYQNDEDALRPLGKGMALFIRAAVRESYNVTIREGDAGDVHSMRNHPWLIFDSYKF